MRYFVSLAILAFSLSLCQAQESTELSIRFQVSYGKSWLKGVVPTNSLDPSTQDCKCPDYIEYEGVFASQSIGLDLRFLEVLHTGLDVGVQSHNGSQMVLGDSLVSLDPDGNVVLSLLAHDGSASMFDAFARLFVSLDLPGQFFISAGASGIMNTSNRTVSVVRILSPPGAIFVLPYAPPGEVIENGRAIRQYSKEFPDFPNMRVDVDASVGKSFVFGDLTVQLLATYRHGLMELTTMKSLRSSSLSGTLGFMYEL